MTLTALPMTTRVGCNYCHVEEVKRQRGAENVRLVRGPSGDRWVHMEVFVNGNWREHFQFAQLPSVCVCNPSKSATSRTSAAQRGRGTALKRRDGSGFCPSGT